MLQKEFLAKMKECVIVYVEDDENIKEIITEYLKRYTSHVYVASNGEDGYSLYEKMKPNLMLLDINTPKLNGIEVATKIRENDSATRIIMVTAYTNKEFMLDAVELNLTRYLVKPITGDEISEAFKKCLLELEELSPELNELNLGNSYIYNQKSKTLSHGTEDVYLRHKELILLDYMTKNINLTLSYETLENALWDDDIVSTNALKAQIKNLRKKLYPGIIHNISGVGYIFEPVEDI